MQTKHLLALLLLALGLPGSGASAHSEGHGPEISGKGPNGGKLVAIISALEADAGAKAKPVALAEWRVRKDQVEVALLALDRKSPIALPSQAELKWILIGAEKPIVIKELRKEALSKLEHAFSAEVLGKTKTIELILPYFETSGLSAQELEKKPLRVLSFAL